LDQLVDQTLAHSSHNLHIQERYDGPQKSYCSKSMRKILLIQAFFLTISTPVVAQMPNPLIGDWQQSDGSVTLRIAPCPGGRNHCGTVVAEQLGPGDRSQMNQIAVRDIKPAGTRQWTGAFISEGKSIRAKFKLQSDKGMAVKFCVMALLCDTVIMNRI
jgi:uncharacterized protein (DUF2147 family)